MKSLLKVLDIIDKVSEAGTAGIRELSAMTGFPPATIHRMVSTLMDRRYFAKDPITRKYSLSLRFLELGSKVQNQFDLPRIARPYMEKIMAETKESINLAVPDEDEMVYIDQVRSYHSILQLFTRPGARVPLYNTGVGKLFLSLLSPSDLKAYLERVPLSARTPCTLVKPKDLQRDLAGIRERGYAVDDEEFEIGVRCVGALLFDHTQGAVAAISISGAVVRISQDKIESIGKLIKGYALAISKELGFKG